MTTTRSRSRARAGLGSAAVAAVTVLVAGGCATPTADPVPAHVGVNMPVASAAPPAAQTFSPGGSEPPATPTGAAPATSPAPTGGSWKRPTLTEAPDPPRLSADPGDFTGPELAAEAYLGAWCYAPADAPANTNINDIRPWVTAAGWADDQARKVDDPTWARIQAAGVSTVCGPAAASVSPQGPSTGTEVWVGVSAQQVRVRGGVLIGQGPVSMVRRVLRADDGRWLVDVRVMAG